MSIGKQVIKRKFEVEALPDTTKRVLVKKENGKNFEYEEVAISGGFMVYFPQGHSIRVRNVEELRRLGISPSKIPLVDMNSGEEVGDEVSTSLKQSVERSTKPARNSKNVVETDKGEDND
jgi:hypothetical protein